MAATPIPSALNPFSSAEANTEPTHFAPNHPTRWDDEIVQLPNYHHESDLSDHDSIASDTLTNDLSDLENAIHDDMSRSIPNSVQRTYSSSESELSVGVDDGLSDSHRDLLAILDYATVDQNGFDELMRFGMYEPDGEPVQGIIIDAQLPASDEVDATIDYGMMDGNGLDELMPFGLFEPDGEPVHAVQLDIDDIFTLLDNDYDAADIETLDTEYVSDDENSSERCFGEVETLDDSDDNEERVFDAALIDGKTDLAGSVAPTPPDDDVVLHEPNTVSEKEQNSCFDENTATTTRSNEVELSTESTATSHPKDLRAKNSDQDTDISITRDAPSVEKRRRSKEDTRRSRASAKKFFKLNKLTRMIKSCFSTSKK